MGVQDREYYREESGSLSFRRVFQTTVGVIVTINVIVWLAQVIGGTSVTEFLALSARDLSSLKLYKVVTAMFAHSPDTVWHLAVNMLFLYFFGRELEQIYGRRDFAIFYVLAGVVSVLAEVVGLWVGGRLGLPVLGASGAVMGVVVVFTLFYPNRQILFFFFVPMPVWLLCVLFVLIDLLGALRGTEKGVASIAHLAGAAVGLAYWFLDFRMRRWSAIAGRWSLRRASRRRSAKIIPMPRHVDAAALEVSRRIDDLLEKISSQGKDSLTEEEWAYLKQNSSRYRS